MHSCCCHSSHYFKIVFFLPERRNIIQAPKPLSRRESWCERKEKKKFSAKAVQKSQQKYKSPYPKAAASYARTNKNCKNITKTAKLTDRKTEAAREPEKTHLPAG